MNTVIRVLVIVITLLGATALTFAILNFNKRQTLLTKVATLVEQTIKVAQTIEAQDATDATPLAKGQMDVSPVTDRVDGIVDKKNVFENYNANLETKNLPKLKFDSPEKKDQLYTLYAYEMDGEKRIIKKDSMGLPVTTGPGTMQELLDQLLERAKNQNAKLETTRDALAKTRELVEDTVDALNKQKAEGRLVQRELTERKEEIVGLKDDKAKLQSEVTKLTSDKRELEAEVADMKSEVEQLQDKQAEMTNQLAGKELMITNLVDRLNKIGRGRDDVVGQEVVLTAGDKGKIVETNDEYKFAIIEFSPAAMAEMLGKEGKTVPSLNMSIRRQGRESASGDFVAKVKLRHSVKDKNLVVADILTDWQQTSVEKGDVVFY